MTEKRYSDKVLDAMAMRLDGFHIDTAFQAEVEANMAANTARYRPFDGTCAARDRPMAIVGYGPTLKHTWERLRFFDGHIWSVSKAHDFLMERGIVPAFHTDTDISAHKAQTVQNPHPGTRYVMCAKMAPAALATVPDPELFNLDIYPDSTYDLRFPLYHVRFDASITAVEIAYKAGWLRQHWFGIDYGLQDGETYAGAHEGPAHIPARIALPDGEYVTSDLMRHGLVLAEHLLNRRPTLGVTIHGDGLLAAFLKARRRCKIEQL